MGYLAQKEGLNVTRVASNDFTLVGNLSCDQIREKGLSDGSWYFLHRLRVTTALRDFLILRHGCKGYFAANPHTSLSSGSFPFRSYASIRSRYAGR